MNEPPTKRGVLTVAAVGIVAIVFLLLGRSWIGNYADQQLAKRRDEIPAPASGGGVAGRVLYADGSPAAGARVAIAWRDSAGRPGTTPAAADDKGAFVQNNVPPRASIVEVRAGAGPMAATVVEPEGSDAQAGASGVRVTLRFPKEFRLAGIVRRVGDRTPVAGAALELAGARTTTGPAGDFKLEHVPWTAAREDRPVVHVTADGYAPLDWPLPKDDPSETYGDLTMLMEPKK